MMGKSTKINVMDLEGNYFVLNMKIRSKYRYVKVIGQTTIWMGGVDMYYLNNKNAVKYIMGGCKMESQMDMVFNLKFLNKSTKIKIR